jgi:DNA-binding transcriptional LysR family regulator
MAQNALLSARRVEQEPIMRGAEFSELQAFVAVAEERNFRRAAARLRLSPSALSHTVRELEERLGAKLLNRTTRSVAPTEAGRSFYERLAPAFADIAEATEDMHALRGKPSGAVRINLPKLAAEIVFAPIFRSFHSAYPDVRLELAVDDGLTDIVAAGFDAGVRPGELVQRDMIAVRVTPDLRTAVVGSPAYLAAHPRPQNPSDLKDHACINFRFASTGSLYAWPFAKEGKRFDVAVEGPLVLNDTGLIRASAVDGLGLACTLETSVAADLASGALVRVLQDWCPPFPGFFLYHPGRRQTPPALRALIDFLTTRGR